MYFAVDWLKSIHIIINSTTEWNMICAHRNCAEIVMCIILWKNINGWMGWKWMWVLDRFCVCVFVRLCVIRMRTMNKLLCRIVGYNMLNVINGMNSSIANLVRFIIKWFFSFLNCMHETEWGGSSRMKKEKWEKLIISNLEFTNHELKI